MVFLVTGETGFVWGYAMGARLGVLSNFALASEFVEVFLRDVPRGSTPCL